MEHPLFLEACENIAGFERDRPFCGHGLNHLLEVARVAYILCLESGEDVQKELVYAAALLHDTGRWRQYSDGTSHELESARIAALILPECGFNELETARIVEAIAAHRMLCGDGSGLRGILFRADKLSRNCWECGAAFDCNWPADQRNKGLVY